MIQVKQKSSKEIYEQASPVHNVEVNLFVGQYAPVSPNHIIANDRLAIRTQAGWSCPHLNGSKIHCTDSDDME